jgi:hypothetical protein
MADMARGAQHEFWHPPIEAVSSEAIRHQSRAGTCEHCRTEFIVGSRYCHNCGATRPGAGETVRQERTSILQFSLGERLGLPTPSLVAFLAGILCVIGALTVGFVSNYGVAPDWQAVQISRIEWLLGAITAFVAGSVLKPRR